MTTLSHAALPSLSLSISIDSTPVSLSHLSTHGILTSARVTAPYSAKSTWTLSWNDSQQPSEANSKSKGKAKGKGKQELEVDGCLARCYYQTDEQVKVDHHARTVTGPFHNAKAGISTVRLSFSPATSSSASSSSSPRKSAPPPQPTDSPSDDTAIFFFTFVSTLPASDFPSTTSSTTVDNEEDDNDSVIIVNPTPAKATRKGRHSVGTGGTPLRKVKEAASGAIKGKRGGRGGVSRSGKGRASL